VAYASAVGELEDGPHRPLGHLSRLGFALRAASDVDAVARVVLRDLLVLPGVRRVGIALSEGGGRRLRFLVTDGAGAIADAWCHIDAYEDVPLTAVVRTGEPILGALDGFGRRFAELVQRQREEGVRALAALPLPGTGAPIGGLILYFDERQEFAGPQRRLLEAAARRTSEAVRRIRAATGRSPARAASGADAPAPAAEPAAGAVRSATLMLDGEAQAVGAARHFLRGLLADWGVDGDVPDTAQLCLSELVTNAVIHAGTGSELTVRLEDGVLTVVVHDLGGSGRPGEPTVHVTEDDDPLRVFGRGLVLVEALASRWGSERDATGTRSWFVLELGDDAPPARTG